MSMLSQEANGIGVNVFRLNFSHVTDPEPQLGDVIRDIRKNSRELGLPIAILGDMGGPKIRCNGFKNEANAIDLKKGDKVKITYSEEDGTDGVITTSVEPVCRQLEPGHRLLLDDGQLNIKILEKTGKYDLLGEVQNSWKLKSRKGINVPGTF
jgi:pyruvate kinase